MTFAPRRIVAAGMLAMLLAAVVVAAATAGAARADGDPASDVLLGENVFYPYSPAVSQSLQNALNAETAAASRAHFPLKVALIDSPSDLGVIPELFGQPQKYADFLDAEISFQGKQLLLVVMPSGYGVRGLSPAATKAAASLAPPRGRTSEDLARAAIVAVRRLAAAAGHSIAGVSDKLTARSGGNDTTLNLVLLVVLASAATAAAILVRRNRTAAKAGAGGRPSRAKPAPLRARRRRR